MISTKARIRIRYGYHFSKTG